MSYEPTSLYSEIVQNLFMGGTADDDVIHLPAARVKRNDLPFDAIVTMYAWARPADWLLHSDGDELVSTGLYRGTGDIRQAITVTTQTITANAKPLTMAAAA